MRWYAKVALALVVLAVAAVGYVAWVVKSQELSADFWNDYPTAKVRFDAEGIPTIEGADWGAVVTAQGFVVASERLWQMDLIRRKAGGRLSEWFGAAAFEHDAKVQAEDRLALTQRAAAALPEGERFFCERYARGVNDFIEQNPDHVGVEYLFLRTKPEPWTCADSLLVLLEMTDVLSSSAESEAQQQVWRRNLSPAWQAFLFTLDHPWNQPYFPGPSQALRPVPPPPAEYLPVEPLSPPQGASSHYVDPDPVGSNNWMWRGKTGAFVANDPHLGNSVPSIWFAMRLRVSKANWGVGVSIPGLPGVILGMNPGLAWAFTNTGEDVDDFLAEKLSDDGAYYLVRAEGGAETWRPILRKTFDVKVKGEDKPRQVAAAFTHRGPLAKRQFLGEDLYSRQWISLRESSLRLPMIQLMQAQTIDEFDRSLDGMTTPSQNVLAMDYHGDMAYRMSGTGVKRRVSGRVPQGADVGEWQGFEPASARRRLLFHGENAETTRFLASANERIWVDPFGANWASEDRKERIVRFLGARKDLKRVDMEELQLDTQSRFRKLLLKWIADRAATSSGPDAATLDSWRVWDGSSRSNVDAFTASSVAEEAFMKLLLGRIEARFPKDDQGVPYQYYLRRAWLLEVLDGAGDSGVAPFGLKSGEVARYLLAATRAANGKRPPHPQANAWRGQHPFVGRIPVVDRLFALEEYPQIGAYDLVRAEQPTFGPSMRTVWDLREPWDSTWVFPVGQSGHVGSPHFRDFVGAWRDDHRLKVFDDGLEWEFAGRHK